QPPSGDGATDYRAFQPLAAKLDPAQVDAALQAAAADIKSVFPKGKQGIWGFCMGGKIALKQAVAHPETYSAAAIFYGAVAGTDPKAMKVPMVGNYGEKDTGIPAADVRAFADALTVPHDIKVYPEAGHAFFDDQRASYVDSAATDAWRRTIAFLGKYLASA
ncbi:MAG: dienelactone hydrolase family protein, partial [Candidatus Eremiobacteraeota bacterium]|nr:dienelactone hydrolase family protein [Candidatus Eremiobacteraeota bacterium]